MHLSHIRLVMLTLPLAAPVGCQSTYDLGDGVSKADAMPGGDAAKANALDAGPGPVNRLLPFPCDEWGNGNQLASPNAALSSALEKVWSGQSAADGLQKYSGQVATAGDLECVIRNALEDARARPFVGSFYAKWLKVDKVPDVQGRAPENVLPSDRFEILANDVVNFAVDVSVAGKANFARLLTSPRPLVSAGAPLPAATEASLAAGVLSDRAVTYANTIFALPFYRGFWFTRTFRCIAVPPEPNFGRTPTPLPSASGSYRQRYSPNVSNVACQGCHQLFDPPGFALDPFDELGRVRQADPFGFPFDTSGALSADEGKTPFTDLHSLAQIVANSDEAASCFAGRWQMYAQGQDPNQTLEVPDSAKVAAAKLRRNNGSITAVIADAVVRQLAGQ